MLMPAAFPFARLALKVALMDGRTFTLNLIRFLQGQMEKNLRKWGRKVIWKFGYFGEILKKRNNMRLKILALNQLFSNFPKALNNKSNKMTNFF